jgi:hypothetical protein
MVAYTFDPQAYQQYVYIDNNTFTSQLDIYAYLGHPVHFYYFGNPNLGNRFTGYILGTGPEQYEFYCFSNQMQLYTQHVAILQHPGLKHIHIEADSTIPPDGAFTIPITYFNLTTELLPAGIAGIQAQRTTEEIRNMIPEEFRRIMVFGSGG